MELWRCGLDTDYSRLDTHPEVVLMVFDDEEYLLVLYFGDVGTKRLEALCLGDKANQSRSVVGHPHLSVAVAEDGGDAVVGEGEIAEGGPVLPLLEESVAAGGCPYGSFLVFGEAGDARARTYLEIPQKVFC